MLAFTKGSGVEGQEFTLPVQTITAAEKLMYQVKDENGATIFSKTNAALGGSEDYIAYSATNIVVCTFFSSDTEKLVYQHVVYVLKIYKVVNDVATEIYSETISVESQTPRRSPGQEPTGNLPEGVEGSFLKTDLEIADVSGVYDLVQAADGMYRYDLDTSEFVEVGGAVSTSKRLVIEFYQNSDEDPIFSESAYLNTLGILLNQIIPARVSTGQYTLTFPAGVLGSAATKVKPDYAIITEGLEMFQTKVSWTWSSPTVLAINCLNIHAGSENYLVNVDLFAGFVFDLEIFN